MRGLGGWEEYLSGLIQFTESSFFVHDGQETKTRMPFLNNRKLKIHLLLTILMMIFIFVQSALPADVSQQESHIIVRVLTELLQAKRETVSFLVRKGAHFTEYLVLGVCLFLTVRDFREQRKLQSCTRNAGPAVTSVFVPWVIGAAYAVTDEIHQYFVPGRSCEVRDMLIDACGTAAGVLLCRWIAQKRKGAGR